MGIGVNLFNFSFSLSKLDLWRNQRDEAIGIIKDAVCFNQGAYTEYSFLAAEKHREFKTALAVDESDTTRIHGRQTALIDYLNSELDRTFPRNFEFLISFLTQRKTVWRPRICVKCVRGGQIVDIVRSMRKSPRVRYTVSSNTGFDYVVREGRPYCCNNIPAQAKIDYKNPRLNGVRAHAYKTQFRMPFSRNDAWDDNWINCWEDDVLADGQHRRPPSDSCYKSTLIIPMTLLGNKDLSSGFRGHLLQTADPEKAIYGFLCMDHADTDFFDEPRDIPVGYIFADLMSLYLIERLRYTEWSSSFGRAEALLRNGAQL